MILYYHPVIRGILGFWALSICLSLVWTLCLLWQQKHFKGFVPTLLFFAACDVYWQFVNANSYFVGAEHRLYRMDSAPIWLIVLINALLSIAAGVLLVYAYRRRRKYVSAVSLKESFDTLPSGICYYEKGGRTYLVNEAMDKITLALLSRHLYNGERLWAVVQSNNMLKNSDNKAIVQAGERVYSFTRYSNDAGNQKLFEIIAADITEEAAQNLQLEQKNRELAQFNQLLDAYNRNLTQIVRERELVQSKARIHDEMNVLMISTLNCVESGDREQAQGLFARWKSNVFEWEKDSELNRKNPLEALEELADTLGIRLEFEGEIPDKAEQMRLMIAAVSECMINALRHAGAATLYVRSDKSGFSVMNDGTAPTAPITEGGGLSNLRKRAQREGAALEIESEPRFMLKIQYQEGESE